MDRQLIGLMRGGLGGGAAAGPGPGPSPAPAAGGARGAAVAPTPQQQQPMQAVLGTLRGVASGALASALLGRRTASSDAAAAAANAAACDPAAAGFATATAAAAAAPLRQARGQEGQATSLKQLMGLPEGPVAPPPMRSLPAAPTKVFPAAHKGSVCSVAVMRPGHFVATCGTDRGVIGWDLQNLTSTNAYHGAAGTVNDAAFTQDGRRLLAACGDKRILSWSFESGRQEHTLTGHGGGVLCVACSALDASVAVSAGEDRCVKVWDLQRGFCVRSLPCAKMPSALALSLDGTTILTGHLDGSLCLWDMRQDRAGGKALAEALGARRHNRGAMT
ncbi:hypothetical protein MNEG_16014 [Monoraphidium neglectum]|uniref:Uncharacterized protein n=1 Tax=Monoraphidium neglectum TaxID=145388 RepID=A0A0D2LIX0_9CHLO|nr:hypothetical protein MNEG_16014 [Monoraphidium neglectum]KIY91949.1 hypothetical protein MNEG_16014 [Monoraphidium neglectum]|eukprot:XP_013890969.1 hypothetical protein MNEG_16014 [Monoraphidium neglectum]